MDLLSSGPVLSLPADDKQRLFMGPG